MNKTNILLAVVALLFPYITSAAKEKAKEIEVKGEWVYVATRGESLLEAEAKALEGAKCDALAKAFGTRVTQDVMQMEEVIGSKESMTFMSNTESTVRGVWLSTKGKPDIEKSFEDGSIVVRCKVEGYGRELSNKAPDIDVRVLNEPSKHAVCSRFKDQDDVYVYVQSPEEDVYAMVCFLDENGKVMRFFPYMGTEMKDARFKKGYEYILFDPDRPSGDFGQVDPFHILAKEPAYNRIFVIYSPHKFKRGAWRHVDDDTADWMTEKEFNKWLLEMRGNDDEMDVKVINFLVEPQDINRETF